MNAVSNAAVLEGASSPTDRVERAFRRIAEVDRPEVWITLRAESDVLADVADRYDLPVLAPPIPRTVRFAEASASGATVLSGRANKGAQAYRELAANLVAHWDEGAELNTFGE